ncbi:MULTISPECIES: bifunctional (p)ppGpp synthetase/guanosine-3',5'-bis(diphosphate) 3'-pyrophosphohydrolase [unclassified Wenzhouxiangella]|uniref:RelA/SpoT family protein n=1 Tax=unclassified Wenzhouxiangella TaxID=2613841 RepID=UPI000E325595|nr:MULTISPECIES: bifunctional (p)ppGpp synthetase/guanosine-3',5'-bis(diphosphate) 3'-pyrophosphohydrolase [unclassified Wenzhouxiangella]RFF27306.1 bifunctional (p)ppGpp synthetase/guanosine-3',5'-bis(diphosphate) 3'-pyrophosphohydrolase [Wenzhouxiangella sp. 15181]RFP68739.1 bifunctional (p)ppGpp synthetase/guanosine-3',5'-bis(diphosphate) 3'-pyrophosphohydrolase [Wenzhouxiangella sp. 15190]
MLPAPVRELRDLLNTYLEPEHVAVVLRAYEIGAAAHEGQKRKSGEDYIMHPVAVAHILAAMRMDHQTIAAAILHDTIEDTEIEHDDLADQFDEQIAKLVDGVTKLDKMKFRTRQEADAESFRKLLLAMSRDLRVIFIKLADRLHNMRTIGHMTAPSRRRISTETLEIYAPIAARLGMNELREELEDLGFQHRHPNRYRVLSGRVKQGAGNRAELIDSVTAALKKKLSEAGIPARVEGRTKTLYSIYCKMRDKSLSFDQVMDLYAFRIVTHSEPHCYQALGVVHALYKPKPGSFKDYIALPKPNGYQSLHTVVNTSFDVPIEIQIRTEEMDLVAEKGAAAHWLYKATPDGQTAVRAREWLLKLVETQSRATDSVEFLDAAKSELFPDEVFVFTPRGKIIDLKADATALDFAYAIHTDVGNQAVGARIDREPVPLNTRLESGQTVEIITQKGATPQPEWLEFVATSKARSSIRAHLKNLEQADSVAIGHRLLDQALARRGFSLEKISERRLDRYLKKLKLERLEDLLIRIARGDMLARIVAHKLLPLTQRRTSEEPESEALTIGGTEGSAIEFANCCHPVPGDPIMGYLSPGKGLVIHRQRCPNVPELRKDHAERCLEVDWAPVMHGYFSVRLKIVTINGPGVLASVSATLSEVGANIERVEQPTTTRETAILQFTLAVTGRDQLARVMRRLRRNQHVLRVGRE